MKIQVITKLIISNLNLDGDLNLNTKWGMKLVIRQLTFKSNHYLPLPLDWPWGFPILLELYRFKKKSRSKVMEEWGGYPVILGHTV